MVLLKSGLQHFNPTPNHQLQPIRTAEPVVRM